MTLQEYISFWQETYDKHQSRPTTYAAHNYVFKNHILPSLGDIPLSELTSEIVGEFLEERRRFGNHRPGNSGLGEETMRHIHRLLQQCLDQSIRDGLLTENPARAFRYRKSTTVKANIMTPLEMEDYLDALAKADTVVFDKTGTLTKGTFAVSAVHPEAGFEADQVLEYAALAEQYSTHPIAVSLREACKSGMDRSRVSNVEEIAGHGIMAEVDGKRVGVGNSRLMERQSVNWLPCELPGTIVHVTIDGFYAGHIVIADQPKPDAKEAIARLKAMGVKKTVMLTGDTKRVAEAVAAELGVDEVRSDLLPADKVSKVEELLGQQRGKAKLAFVGDGINDAPVLSRADIGIAMGAMGSDAAIEAADIVLMDDEPMQIAKAIKISRKCIGIVYQNIVFALVVKFACLALVAIGLADMWAAIFADVGVMVLAVLNAIRALRVHNL